MSLATLFNTPRSPNDFEHFSIANEAEHNEVGNAIFAKMKIEVPTLLLRPLFPEDSTGWLIRHSTLHTRINEILKLANNDLMVVDFRDPAAVQEWAWLHASEHRQWRASLEI